MTNLCKFDWFQLHQSSDTIFFKSLVDPFLEDPAKYGSESHGLNKWSQLTSLKICFLYHKIINQSKSLWNLTFYLNFFSFYQFWNFYFLSNSIFVLYQLRKIMTGTDNIAKISFEDQNSKMQNPLHFQSPLLIFSKNHFSALKIR